MVRFVSGRWFATRREIVDGKDSMISINSLCFVRVLRKDFGCEDVQISGARCLSAVDSN